MRVTDLPAVGDACPTGCSRTRRQGHLMCGPCWAEVPKDQQDAVLRTWRTWRRNFGDLDALTSYQAARAAAIAGVR